VSVAAGELRRRDLWLALGWVLVAVVVVLSLLPLIVPAPSFSGIDKLEHALAYAVMTAWFMALVPAPRRWPIAVAMLVLGAAVEVAQQWTGWRRAEWLDLAADAVGIAAGWLLATGIGARPFAVMERWLGWDHRA
jgi:VanZ family protein